MTTEKADAHPATPTISSTDVPAVPHSWAQCSGKRDPTKFVKKSELVTSAGIDHDFNFLSGIERNLEKAERVASATTSSHVTEAKLSRQRAGVPYPKLEAAASVKIIRAPQGMSRQKENKSHMSATKKASRNIVWTVEWFDETKKRVLTETSSTYPLRDVQPFKQHSTGAKSKKRKLNAEDAATTERQRDATHPSEDQDQQHQPKSGVEHQIDDARPGPQSPEQPAKVTDTHPAKVSSHGPSIQTPEHMLFLLKPRTSTNRHVVIPLDPSRTLAENLHGHTILEFPTIYVFPPATEKLPEDFMLEEEYAKLEGEQQKEFDELMNELDPDILKRLKEGEDAQRYAGADEEVDSKKILDVLKQDIGGL
ncbi:HIT finger domain-containing protein [Pyrenophora tritici-repentis]|uniref:HIT finger domain containing protein n=1 Tax=Pyrenophora tritici-repentis TaxID=45151 RepID=A0A2W1GYH4_9PLEO|nr:HIT finger domain-containing protein [Pyrenophora tritici-repentis]KAI0619050.1 HIT finger domain-containing protein [Pyrenophora tritici-repentis]KAI1520670.1 HIT finger domain containing protein [Pyrenophora tritici-repentis]KAI1687893.1 HIT finger domain containing protein [Pyrenophora tritici-repentis]PZD41819.1 Sdh5 domain containing protein [Pyrenophora tritici-repentis]